MKNKNLSDEIKELKKILRDKWVAKFDTSMYYAPNSAGIDLYLDDFTTKSIMLEEKIRLLNNALYKIRNYYGCISEECVSESKSETDSDVAVENIRDYLVEIGLEFDAIEDKYGTNYFIKVKKEQDNA